MTCRFALVVSCSVAGERLKAMWPAGGYHQDQVDQGVELWHLVRWEWEIGRGWVSTGEGVTQNVRGVTIGSIWTKLSSWHPPPGLRGWCLCTFLGNFFLFQAQTEDRQREDSAWARGQPTQSGL